MKFFLAFAFVITVNSLIAQCSYKLNIDVLSWEGSTITIKWRCDPKIGRDSFYIFRTCLTLKDEKEKFIGSVSAAKNLEYSDADRALIGSYIYKYRVQMRDFPQCSTQKRTQGRVIQDDSLSVQPMKDLKSFTQKDVLSIKTAQLTATSSTFFPVEIDIKDFKFPFANNLTFALLCADKIIETQSHVINDDFRFAEVFILENDCLTPKFRIAVIQGNEILGISAFIQARH